MESWYKQEILNKLSSESKILIGLGDSFTRGEDACSIEIWEKYNWDLSKSSTLSDIELSKSFYENSWVNKLCKNYLNDFVPINLGMSGRGNRAAIKEIYLNPEFDYQNKKEIIVVFMLSGMERFDFVHDNFDNHFHFKTMWPKLDHRVSNNPEKNLWNAYFEHVWGERFGVTELLLNISEIKVWCKAHNAKLMLISAFRPDYQKNEFLRILKLIKDNPLNNNEDYLNKLVEIVDWENFIRPGGFRCVTDFLCHLENRDDLITEDLFALSAKFYEYSFSHEKLSDKGFMSKSGHPSLYGHEEIAKQIYNAYKEKKFIKL